MTSITFQFDQAKAVEAILYLAQKVSDADIYGICKLLYLVDKTSLEKYGRFIFGETYSAMKEGATPSNAYDLLKEANQAPINGVKVEENQVIALRDPNLDYLSKSDKECLNQIIKAYGEAPYWVLGEMAHDDAWRKSWGKRGKAESVRMPIEDIAELLAESTDLIDYLSNRGAD